VRSSSSWARRADSRLREAVETRALIKAVAAKVSQNVASIISPPPRRSIGSGDGGKQRIWGGG